MGGSSLGRKRPERGCGAACVPHYNNRRFVTLFTAGDFCIAVGWRPKWIAIRGCHRITIRSRVSLGNLTPYSRLR